MFTKVKKYCYGCVAIPVILSCKKHGLFNILNRTRPMLFNVIVKELQANSRHLRTALFILESLNWIVRTGKDEYLLTPESEIYEKIPEDIIDLMSFSMGDYNNDSRNDGYKKWIELSLQRWFIENPSIIDFLDGMLLIPILHGLKDNSMLNGMEGLKPGVCEEIVRLLTNKGWVSIVDGGYSLTEEGKNVIGKISTVEEIMVYKPMLENISEIIFRDDNAIPWFKRGRRFSDEKYLSDLEEMILSVFNKAAFGEQPKHIVALGCGNGEFLREIYEIVRKKSLRGNVLEEYPIKLIGIDSDVKALVEMGHTLKDTDYITINCETEEPERVIAAIRGAGISDTENILFVHSFGSNGGFYIERWANIFSKHGLIMLEEHRVKPGIANKFVEEYEGLYIDMLYRFSDEQMAEADGLLMAAAGVGLFPNHSFFRKYPKTIPFSRFTLNYFEQREYSIRYARETDLPDLERLENLCWEPGLRVSTSVLKKRLLKYPEGQLVMEINGKIVGAMYTQRIIEPEDIKKSTFKTVEKLHTEEGTVIQLLTVNILPDMQHLNLGDQLLEFMLQRCGVINGITKTVAVTKCKDYHKHENMPLEGYIGLRNEQGRLVDTVLRFHEMHGAQIKELVPGYRPLDIKNKGNGVFVEYDIHNRQRRDIQINTVQSHINRKSVKEFIVERILQILGIKDENGFTLDRPLMEMGLDSGDLMDLKEQISFEYRLQLEPAFFFEYNTPEKIISYLEKYNVTDDGLNIIESQESIHCKQIDNEKQSEEAAGSKDIAVIGAACRLPGGIMSKEQLWQFLMENKDAITKMPGDRFAWPEYIDPENTHKGIDLGGFMGDIANFDAHFFRISPKEAELIDPQQRILQELSWECLEEAGYSAKAVSGSKTGVFIGASGSDYNRLLDRELENIEAHYGTGVSMAVLSNRISYFYDFHGPSIQLDTACSSSLVAIHEAVKSLQSGECEQALVGGVNVICHPSNSIAYYKAGMLAKAGGCKTFDKGADGYVRGEGAVMIFLKPLEKAQNDNDSILAVIKGSAVNHGGQASGLTVPNPAKQALLLIDAYKTAGVEPETVSYIEAHGTGTSLGDPIEISGLKEAFSQLSGKKTETIDPYCGLGSIKTNIGHLEAAAGIAGLLKVVLCLWYKSIPASLNFKELNPHINLTNTPFYIVNKSQAWQPAKSNSPRRAGVSSFGSGGANAHVVLEEAPSVTKHSSKKLPGYIVCLSAKTEEVLTQKEKDIALWLDKDGRSKNLFDICATLFTGREHFGIRAAYVVRDVQELQEKLREVRDTGFTEGYYRDKRKQLQPGIEQSGRKVLDEIQSNKEASGNEYINSLKTLAELYARGYEPDWRVFFSDAKPCRISLPTYPFARERYWVPKNKAKSNSNAAGCPPIINTIHPLLHQNTSTLIEHRFTSIFSGQEFFLADYIINGKRALPGTACLEMARVAVEQAMGIIEEGPTAICLKNVVWARPMTMGDRPLKVHIELLPREGGEIDYEIYSRTENIDAEPVVYSQGRAVPSSKIEAPVLDLPVSQSLCSLATLSSGECYEAFKTVGLHYGTEYMGIEKVYIGSKQVWVKLSLPSTVSDTLSRFVLHPSLVEAALQAAIGLASGADSDGSKTAAKPALPFNLEELEIFGRCTTSMWALVRPGVESKESDKVQKLDIDLCDEKGKVCVRFKGLSSCILKGEAYSVGERESTGTLMLQPCWKEEAIGSKAVQNYNQHLVMFCENIEVSRDSMENIMHRMRIITLQSKQKSIDKQFQDYAVQVFEELRNIIINKPAGKVLVQVVVPAQGEQQLFSGLSGLLKTAQLENPKLVGQLIEVDENSDVIWDVLEKNGRSPADKHIRYWDGKRYVAGWNEIEASQEEMSIPWKDRGVYLITGGAGGLGLIFAKEITDKARGSVIILTGRSPLNEDKKARLKELESLGARVEYKQVDVTRVEAVSSLIQSIQEEYGNLHGIIHSAGIIRDNFILKKTREELEEVLAPKVAGVVSLDKASKDLPLDFFILFSSTSGSLGNVGQADYAAANAFVDAYAGYRSSLAAVKQRQGQTLSVNWPLWKAGGMHVDEETEKIIRHNTGVAAMKTSSGIRALYQGLAFGREQIMVMEGDLPQMQVYMSEFLSKVHTGILKECTLQVDQRMLREKTLYQLKILFSEVSKFSVSRIDPEEPMESYGIDSIMINQLNQKLAGIFGELSKTLFFEYQTLDDLAGYLAEDYPEECMRLTGLEEQVRIIPKNKTIGSSIGEFPVLASLKTPNKLEGIPSKTTPSNSIFEPVAIIGISGHYPQAKTLKDYWEVLKTGKDCITEIPEERWPIEGFYHKDPREAVALGKSYSKWGGFIEEFADFDPLFFNISPREALNMDPQERLIVETCWEAMEDGGYTREQLAGQYKQRVGVFIGITKTGFALHGPELRSQGENIYPNTSFSSVANRVSYLLNLKGPSMPIDTMCSASLTAIHEACMHLQHNECEMAIAGGVNLYLHPSTYIELCMQKMLSSDGKCRSFGKGASGFVPGEGVGVVLLKPLSRAIADKDHIYAVIRGTSINHGGKTNGYTVPNPNAQGDLIRAAMDKAGIDSRIISYIESHGTGTELGDPIEITGLSQAFRKDTQDTGFCAIGSVKSNIGHLEAAAGIAGVTKVVLQMKHKKIVPSLHSKELNPNINFEKTPFVVQQELTEWKRPVVWNNGESKEYPRIAGISSFGAGGSNAHVIIEEYIEENMESSQTLISGNYPAVIVLSAKNEEQLRQQVLQLLEVIWERQFLDSDLVHIAYTLQVGREAMEERLAVVVRTIGELEEKLKSFLEGQDGIEELYRGQVKRNKESIALLAEDEDMAKTIDAWVAKRKYKKLLDFWVKGLTLNWELLYGEDKPRRISLPTYPFARERYWIPQNMRKNIGQSTAEAIDTIQDLYPPLHNNEPENSVAPAYQNQEPYELMTFEEIWQEQDRPNTSSVEMKTIVCFVSNR
ncbi:MAG: SDR family NAD(P)-dependent oxidoreductase, partial [Clostridia bacterium]|nr:SDR family NAD(P)-dependent oxidoreductase [Clostridia bacterium]